MTSLLPIPRTLELRLDEYPSLSRSALIVKKYLPKPRGLKRLSYYLRPSLRIERRALLRLSDVAIVGEQVRSRWVSICENISRWEEEKRRLFEQPKSHRTSRDHLVQFIDSKLSDGERSKQRLQQLLAEHVVMFSEVIKYFPQLIFRLEITGGEFESPVWDFWSFAKGSRLSD